jgi:iron complex outermembrane recepter protein
MNILTSDRGRSISSRRVLLALMLAMALSAKAQTAPAPASSTDPDDKGEVHQMSVYRVVSSQDQGYAASTATPFKTKQDMVDIPQSITVITRDLMDDIGEYDLAKTLTYVGGVPKFGGELFQLRGSNAFSTYPVVDGLISRTVYMDNVFIDSVEIIRGPAALLYPNSQLSGVINKTTRRPQSKASHSLTAKVTDYGLYRVVGDTTGPIGRIGEGQLNYRLLGGVMGGDAYFTNAKEDRTMVHPSLQWDYANTTIMVAYDYQEITRPSNPTAVLQPNGRIFTGIGRENSLFLPPGASETHEHNGFRGSVVHQYSRNWESRIGLDWNRMHRVGSVVLPTGGVNWNTRTISLFNRRNDILLENSAISMDTNGRYELAGMQHQSTFGFNITSQKATTKLWVNPNYGGPATQFAVRPIDNPNVNAIPALPIGSFVQPANPGSRVRSEFSNFYFQQNAEVIKDTLLLVAGYSKFKDETNNLANFTVNTATLARVNANLYRFGAVAQFLDKKLVFYAMKANNQLPPSPTAILQDGSSVPGAEGEGTEAGVKVSLMGGRLNATLSFFDLETSGLAVFGGVLPDGRTYNVLLGKTKAKGFDGEINFSLSRQFEVIANFYSGDVEDQNGLPVEDSYKSTIGVMGKYSFRDGPAKGLALGAGGYHTTGRMTGTGALTYTGKPVQIENDSDPIVKVFATYHLNSNWNFKLEVDNVFDGLTPLAINSATLLETNLPRNVSLQVGYRF